MQYQEFLLTINIFLIVLILAFIKDNYTRKLYIAATICAYVLAALLPYLLARSTLSVTILFYALVIGFISFFTYDQYKSAMNRTYVEAAADNEQGSISKTELPAGEESVVQPELPTAEIEAIAEGVSSDKGELPVLIGAAQIPADVKQVDEHRTVLETVQTEEPEEPAGAPESPLPDDIPAAEAPPPEDTGVEPLTDDSEDRMIEEAVAQAVYDIEHLIDLAFEARARGDYHGTLTILETILEQDPPEEIVDLILDDVEVLFAKLVS